MGVENTKKDNNTGNVKDKKKMSLLAKILFGLAGVIVLLVIVVVCYVLHLLSLPEIVPPNDGTTTSSVVSSTTTGDNTSTGDVVKDPTTTTTEEETEDLKDLPTYIEPSTSEGDTVTKETAAYREEKGVYNIILLGVDPESHLTDSMIVATINQNNHTIKLTSFMRDILVSMEGYPSDRLNTVFKRGGMKLLKQVFKDEFGIGLYGYVKVDYNILVDVVDALGGIELYVSKELADFVNTSNYIKDEASRNIIPGVKQQLNGYQVVGVCRVRQVSNGHESGDYARTQRQREVLMTIYEKFRNSDVITLLGLMEKILPLVQTDLDKSEMLNMATMILSGVRNDIEQLRIPLNSAHTQYAYLPEGATKSKSVLKIDTEKNVAAIHKFLYGSEE